MKTMFLSAIPAALVLAFMTYSAEGQTPGSPVPGVAYVNSQRIINEVISARTELARVTAMQQQKSAELRGKQQAIDATRQQLAAGTDEESRTRLLKQEQDQRADFDRSAQQAQADLQRMQREVQAEIQAQVKRAAEELSRTQNFRIVLNADTSVVWAAPGMDITNLLVDKLNAQGAAKP